MLHLIETLSTGYELMARNVFHHGIELSLFGRVAREERRSIQRRKRGCKSRHIHFATRRSQKEHQTLGLYQTSRSVPATSAPSYSSLVSRVARQPSTHPIAAGRPLIFVSIEGWLATLSYQPLVAVCVPSYCSAPRAN